MPFSFPTMRHLGVLISILIFAPLAPLPTQAGVLQCSQIPDLFEAYFGGHYAYKGLNDDIRQHTVEQLIKEIDPSKTLLLEADVAKLKRDIPALFKTAQTGDCTALNEAYQMMITRSQESSDFAKQYLGPKYKFDESVELNLDPEKRKFPKDNAEKLDAVQKMIHFQISNYLLAELKLPEAKKQLIHRYELVTKRLKERKREGLMTSYAEAFAMALDPHSGYLSQDSLEDFQIQMHLSLEGIGASSTSDDGFTVIEETIPGGGAEKTNMLRPKDKIIAVAQNGAKPVTIIDMDLRDVVKLIRGKKGTKVTLTILRQAEKTSTFDVTIVRDKIDIKEQAAKITYESRKVGERSVKLGVIDLPSFYGGGEKGGRSCSADVKALLEEAKKEKVDGIVLNLSRNGGGLLDEAVKILSLY